MPNLAKTKNRVPLEDLGLTYEGGMNHVNENAPIFFEQRKWYITSLWDRSCDLMEVLEVKTVETSNDKKPIKSDGGSSSYYDMHIPDWLLDKMKERRVETGKAFIKTEECCEVFFDNDFDYSNMFKSMVRSFGAEQGGGKYGNTVDYEMSKCQYSAEKIKELSKRRADKD